MNKLPPNWTMASIGDLGEIRLGKMLDRAKNQGLPAEYLRNINVRWFHFDLADLRTIFVAEEEKNLLAVEDGDVFICEGGEPGRCAVWRGGSNALVYQKALHRFRTIGAMVPELLMYRVRHDADTGALAGAFTGTTIKHLTRESLAGFQIPVPPIPEQMRIADMLDAVLARVDACRERLDRVPDILKRFRQSVLAEATSGNLTTEWRGALGLPHPHNRTLGEVIKVSSGKFLSSKQMAANGNIPVFGGNGVNGYHDQGNVLAETIVIGRVGFYCGSVHLTPPSAWVTDNALIVRHDETIITRKFLYFALQSVDLRANDSSTAQPVISARKINPTPITIPVLREQGEIVRRVETLFAYADRLEARYAAARAQVERLTPALLAKAFRGELVPQNPDDEPASVLLERIRAARAAAPAKPRRRATALGDRQAKKAEFVPPSSASLANGAKLEPSNDEGNADDACRPALDRSFVT